MSMSDIAIIGPDVVLLKGIIGGAANRYLARWLDDITKRGVQNAIILIDSDGGHLDLQVLVRLLTAPVHVHVLKHAFSYAGVLALCGSYKTAAPGSIFMFHAAKHEYLGDEKALFQAMYPVTGLMGSLIPSGPCKTEVCKALLSPHETFVYASWLEENKALDRIVDYSADDLRICNDLKNWYNDKYINER